MKNIILSESVEREILRKIDAIKEQVKVATRNNLEEAKSKGLLQLLRTYRKLWTVIE